MIDYGSPFRKPRYVVLLDRLAYGAIGVAGFAILAFAMYRAYERFWR